MKKALIALIAIALVGYAAYAYITRPVGAPTQDVGKVSAKLPAGSATSTVYRISQEKSLVTFTMNELLNNKPKLVVGTTTQVGGDIEVKDGKIVLGTLSINAKTLVTDNANRNGAIVRLILKSDKPENEIITFKPASISDAQITAGKASFAVMGDLTISGVTKLAAFTVTAAVTDSQIKGTAETKIKRSDFGLTIPNLSFIANVDDEFPVKAEIVADRIMF